MAIQPWRQTQTSPIWTITLSVPGNANAPDLTGLVPANITLVIVDAGTGATLTTQGSVTAIVSYKNPATITYQPNANDPFVLSAKNYRLYFSIAYPNGPDLIGPYNFTTSAL